MASPRMSAKDRENRARIDRRDALAARIKEIVERDPDTIRYDEDDWTRMADVLTELIGQAEQRVLTEAADFIERHMADKGWAHPERITDSAGRVLRWNAFQINPDVDEWEDAPADRMEEDT